MSSPTPQKPCSQKNMHSTRILMLVGSVAFIIGMYTGILLISVGTGWLDDSGTHAPVSLQDQREMQRLEALTTQDAANLTAWNKLGHLYYDTHQPEKAIAAYQRSLHLAPNQPDILVDMGVMHRVAGRPQLAVSSFETALRLNGAHQHALLNKGIVLLYDLGDAQAAREAWLELLRHNPRAALPDGTPLGTVLSTL